MAYSVGVGLTNECNLRCPHCYRPDAVIDRLTVQEIQRVCEAIPVRSMNLGVGENGLHPGYQAILDYLTCQGIVTSITSNGLSTELLTDAELTRFRSVEFSLDFPTEQEHDGFRGRGRGRLYGGSSRRSAGGAAALPGRPGDGDAARLGTPPGASYGTGGCSSNWCWQLP